MSPTLVVDALPLGHQGVHQQKAVIGVKHDHKVHFVQH